MPHFKERSAVRIEDSVVIVKCLDSGTQADVYEGLNLTKRKAVAVKHLYGNYSTNKYTYYKKVKLLCQYPQKDELKWFIWPQAVSEYDSETSSFLYTMDLLSPEYKKLSVALIEKFRGIMTDKERMVLVKELTDVYSHLHSKKFLYGDISGNNIYYRFKADGSVDLKIIDCDNIAPENFSLGLNGTGKFRSCELILGGHPTFASDAHALAVTVFWVLVGSHPLDGTRARSEAFTEEAILKFYGKEPHYIFDKDGANPPRDEVFRERYNRLPKPLRLYFDWMFSQTCLKNPDKRPSINELNIIFKNI